jgi:hypothetical protein
MAKSLLTLFLLAIALFDPHARAGENAGDLPTPNRFEAIDLNSCRANWLDQLPPGIDVSAIKDPLQLRTNLFSAAAPQSEEGFQERQAQSIQYVSSSQSDPAPHPFHRIEAPALENPFQLTTNLFSGGTPQGDEGFRTLQKLGVKTLITVDGAQPDLQRAHAHGMRYIHLPHGYDGIPRPTQLALIKSAQTADGPIYIHCHHGKHRGPAAAAIICLSAGAWTKAQADQWLTAAGTDTNYVGLFKTVSAFEAPTGADLARTPTDLPESQKPTGIVEFMLAIDETFDHLTAIRKAGYTAPPNHPDLTAQNELTILREHFREAARLPDAIRRGQSFLESLASAEAETRAFEDAINSSTERGNLDRSFQRVSNTCASCHRKYRDQ